MWHSQGSEIQKPLRQKQEAGFLLRKQVQHAEGYNGSIALLARTVGEGVALGTPEVTAAVDDTLAELTNTGGIGNVLAPEEQRKNKEIKLEEKGSNCNVTCVFSDSHH